MPSILVEVCAGTHCTLMGAMDIISAVEGLAELRADLSPGCVVEVRPIPCNHSCDNREVAPVVYVNGEMMIHTNTESVMEKVLAIAREEGCL